MNPIISVIIPVYNLEDFVGKCIESILCQSLKEWEVIIINDGSSDNSLSICKSFSENDSRIIVVNQENRGVSFARNTGLIYARGEWVLFIDGDDTLCPNALTSMINIANNNDVDVVITSFVRNGKLQKYEKEGIFDYKEYELATLRLQLQMSTQNRLYKRHLFNRDGYCIDRKISNNEDYLQNIIILPYINKVAIYNIPTYNVLERIGSASRRDFPIDYWMMFFDYAENLFLEKDISYEIFGRMFLNRTYNLLRRYPNYEFNFREDLIKKVVKAVEHLDLNWREKIMLISLRLPKKLGFRILQTRLKSILRNG